MDLHAWITQQVDETEAEGRAMLIDPTPILRRREADRRILARHQAWPQSEYCDGCDADLTTYLNDCPELLDLAHAHGITPEILAGLDRPQPAELQPATGALAERFDRAIQHLLGPSISTADVPAALRGPNWKP